MTDTEWPFDRFVQQGDVYQRDTGKLGRVYEVEIGEITLDKTGQEMIRVYTRTPEGESSQTLSFDELCALIGDADDILYRWSRDD